MANEIGYWNGGAGAVSESYGGGDSLACVDTGLHTVGQG